MENIYTVTKKKFFFSNQVTWLESWMGPKGRLKDTVLLPKHSEEFDFLLCKQVADGLFYEEFN